MPSYLQHDRSADLFPISSRTRPKPVLPVTPLTRADIENQLNRALEQKAALNRIYKQHANTRQLKPVTRMQLFSDPVPAELPTNGSSSGSLFLHRVREYSLFGDKTADETRQADRFTMQVEEYAEQRQQAVDEQGNARPMSLSIEIPEPVQVHDDILQEVLNDASLWSASSTFVVTPQDTSLSTPVQSTPTPIAPSPSTQRSLPVPRSPSATRSSPTSAPPTSAPPTSPPPTSAPQTVSSLGVIPERHLPVFATPLQQKLCDQITQPNSTFDKISFEKAAGILNHPVIAMADDYVEGDEWDGSGKTKFIKRLVEHLQREQLTMRIVVATYDNDTESFLYNKIRTSLNLPCQRINSILDDVWEPVYGVMFETQNSGVSLRESKAEVDFMVVFDIRLRPGNPIFSKISSKRGSNPPQAIWLYTVGSIEHRAITFFNTHTNDDTWNQTWWSNDAEYRTAVHQNNTWPEESDATLQQTAESVTTWAKNGCSENYMFTQREPTPPPPPVIPAAEPMIPQSPDNSSDMDIDSDNEEEELPESVKAQVRQFFRYPSLRPSFDRPQSRASSPRIRNRNNRWREPNPECDEDEDDVASFYSASEYVQDIKPIPASDSESTLIINNAISNKLNSLKPAFEKEYQAIIARLQAQYQEQVSALQAKYEQQAYERLRDT